MVFCFSFPPLQNRWFCSSWPTVSLTFLQNLAPTSPPLSIRRKFSLFRFARLHTAFRRQLGRLEPLEGPFSFHYCSAVFIFLELLVVPQGRPCWASCSHSSCLSQIANHLKPLSARGNNETRNSMKL